MKPISDAVPPDALARPFQQKNRCLERARMSAPALETLESTGSNALNAQQLCHPYAALAMVTGSLRFRQSSNGGAKFLHT